MEDLHIQLEDFSKCDHIKCLMISLEAILRLDGRGRDWRWENDEETDIAIQELDHVDCN